MYEKIKSAITKHMQDHRLVFWYDEDAKHRAVLDELDAPGSVLEVANNEWWIKYHVLKEKPSERFLIYSPHPRPDDRDNWLLDLVLAGFAFSHDLSETYRNELGLGAEFRTFFAEHVSFFQNLRERFEPLQELVEPETETPASLAVKMMGVLTAPDAESRREPRPFGRILLDLAEEAFSGGDDAWQALEKFSLVEAFRSEVRTFLPDAPDDIKPSGAAISVFREAWALELGGDATASRRNCRVLLHEWRDRYAAAAAYRSIVDAVQDALQIRDAVKDIKTDTLSGLFLFPAVDSELANRLVQEVTEATADYQRIGQIARSRIGTYWNRDSQPHIEAIYELIATCVDLEQAIHAADLATGAPQELTRRYVDELYRVDQLYRQCLSAYRRAGSRGSLSGIIERVEGRYLNDFLQPLVEAWDSARAAQALPDAAGLPRQRRFFDTEVAPQLERGEKLVVIISDALRYEAGRELAQRLNAVNRVSAESDAILAAAPTITAVGMNALLPHRQLAFSSDAKVTVDGKFISGLEARSAYLDQHVRDRFPGKRAAAFHAHDITQLPSAAARERISGLDLIYLYSSGIDAAADNAKTEDSLPEAVDEELRSIEQTVRKFANQLNRTHIIITADHGFLYQSSQPVDAHLIAAERPEGGERERRYIAGGDPPGKHFVSADVSDLCFQGSDQLHFAEGLYRVRKQGPGVKYVHGGLSLQELVVPLVRVHVNRADDVTEVEVTVLKSAAPVITAPTLPVDFYQTEPATEKRKGLRLRAYFAAEDGTIISDTAEMDFDSGDPNAQNRTQKVSFHFGPGAVKYNGQTVHLKLEKLIGGAAVPYREEAYRYQTFGERDF